MTGPELRLVDPLSVHRVLHFILTGEHVAITAKEAQIRIDVLAASMRLSGELKTTYLWAGTETENDK